MKANKSKITNENETAQLYESCATIRSECAFKERHISRFNHPKYKQKKKKNVILPGQSWIRPSRM